MGKTKLYISAIAADAHAAARKYGLDLENNGYGTAWKKPKRIQSGFLQAPFNERFPCAINGGGCMEEIRAGDKFTVEGLK